MARRWTRKRIVWTCYGLIVPAAITVSLLGHQLGHYTPAATPTPSPSVPQPPTSTGMPLLIDDPSMLDDDIEGYYYCWDAGDAGPHRIGHYVRGDHLCTWGELRAAGVVWMRQ